MALISNPIQSVALARSPRALQRVSSSLPCAAGGQRRGWVSVGENKSHEEGQNDSRSIPRARAAYFDVDFHPRNARKATQ